MPRAGSVARNTNRVLDPEGGARDSPGSMAMRAFAALGGRASRSGLETRFPYGRNGEAARAHSRREEGNPDGRIHIVGRATNQEGGIALDAALTQARARPPESVVGVPLRVVFCLDKARCPEIGPSNAVMRRLARKRCRRETTWPGNPTLPGGNIGARGGRTSAVTGPIVRVLLCGIETRDRTRGTVSEVQAHHEQRRQPAP
jgi:hypothetical protein